jgi:REP element-mobilizing transposase RayT
VQEKCYNVTMRRVRITYPGAYHHVMNRGYDGNAIFADSVTKSHFLAYLENGVKEKKMRIFAYCIMDNHYHMVLENSTGKMSDFMKLLNGNFGMYYRRRFGGQGYVFQSRFKSTIIEDDSYLIQSIIYTLQNPVRAGLVSRANHYIWSSAHCYFSHELSPLVDTRYINELFGSKDGLFDTCDSMGRKELCIIKSEYGEVLGSSDFINNALDKYDRRQRPTEQSIGSQRRDELYYAPVEQIIQEFQSRNGIDLYAIDTRSREGQRLRGELLVKLKEGAGLTYKEIAGIEIFKNLKFSTLRSMYRNKKSRGHGEGRQLN